MARKRLKMSSGGPAPWLNTFADLMNLLLCFFVMLFAFSDINVDKFEKVSISMANSFGITKNSTGPSEEMIGTGMSQLPGLEAYYTGFQTDEGETGALDDQKVTDTKEAKLDQALATLNEELEAASAAMYDKVSDLSEQYSLTDYIELSMDPDHKYVELTMKGSVLYDSGEADIKKEALPILNSIGKLLTNFKDYNVEITGHTDNVPMSETSQFKDNNWLSSARALNAAQYLIQKCDIDPETLKYSGRGEYEPIASNATEAGRSKNRRIEIKIFNEYSSE